MSVRYSALQKSSVTSMGSSSMEIGERPRDIETSDSSVREGGRENADGPLFIIF